MTDIVERLRSYETGIGDYSTASMADVAHLLSLIKEAANEIERLRSDQIEALRAFNAKLDDIQSELITVHERIRKLGI